MRFLVLCLVGCAEIPELPASFRMTGTATATEGEITADCAMDLLFELDPAGEPDGGAVARAGTHGGELIRNVLDDEGAGFGFRVDVFGEVVVTVERGGAMVVEIPINATGEGRFYTSLVELPGVAEDDGTATGTWTCAPLDLDQGGYVDETVVAQGTWQVAALPDTFTAW
jgi:hypothetical protein